MACFKLPNDHYDVLMLPNSHMLAAIWLNSLSAFCGVVSKVRIPRAAASIVPDCKYRDSVDGPKRFQDITLVLGLYGIFVGPSGKFHAWSRGFEADTVAEVWSVFLSSGMLGGTHQ